MSTVCNGSLFDTGSNYIKVGNGEFLAIEGSGIAERLKLSELRIPYKQILKGKVILKPGQSNYLLNYLGLGDNVTFLAIKATYNSYALEEENYITWKRFDNILVENEFAQLMVLTGNSAKRIPQLFLTNPNTKYSVTLDLMIAIIDDETSFYNYKPVVYFTDIVTLDSTEYTLPFNTSMGDTFGATLSGPTYSKDELVDLLVDEVRDSNGYTMSTDSSDYILYDIDDDEIISIDNTGTYSMYFDITDTLGNSVDPIDKIEIIVA